MKLFLVFIYSQLALGLTFAFFITKSSFTTSSSCKYKSSLYVSNNKLPEKRGDKRSVGSSKSSGIKKSYSKSSRSTNKVSSPKALEPTTTKQFNEIVSSPPNTESDVKGLVKLDDDERLQKVIARAGIASRRKAEELVRQDR
jgi:hypothetical protein